MMLQMPWSTERPLMLRMIRSAEVASSPDVGSSIQRMLGRAAFDSGNTTKREHGGM